MFPKKNLIRIAVFILLPLFAAALYFFFQATFLRKAVIFAVDFPIKGLAFLNRTNLIFLDTKRLEQDLMKQNGDFAKLEMRKILPDRLEIHPVFRIPFARVYYRTEASYLVDQEGYVVTLVSPEENLPEISAYGVKIYDVANKPDWRLVKALEYLKNTRRKGIPIQNIKIDNGQNLFEMIFTGGEKALVPQISAQPIITDSLQIIISRFRIEGKFVSSIDFRADKPVVTLKNE